MFIAIEGADACGKDTQTKLLEEALVKAGRNVFTFSFPRYDTPLGKLIRRHLEGHCALMDERSRDSSDIRVDGDTYYAKSDADALMFQSLMHADKSDASTAIKQYLKDGYVVLADRWWPAGFAYGAADGLPPEWMVSMSSVLPQPDLNLLIDVSEEEALRRRPKLRDRYEKDRTKQIVVGSWYRALWREGRWRRTGGRWVEIDGHGDKLEVHRRIVKAVRHSPADDLLKDMIGKG